MEKLAYLGTWDDARCLFVLLSGRLSAAGYVLGWLEGGTRPFKRM